LEEPLVEPFDSQILDFGGPATYQIVVQGALRRDWEDRLSGMAISTDDRGGGVFHTTLFGRIRDQAELKGVLETLYGLHVPILKLEKVADPA
jgi:hypothetical protein